MEKNQTKNDNISISNSIFLKCTKGRGIKISPLFIKRNHNDDILYYKIELLERDDESGDWYVVNGGTWNLYFDEIEKLFHFISATTQLKTKDTVAIIDKDNEQLQYIKNLLKNQTIVDLVSNGDISVDELSSLRDSIRFVEIRQAVDEFENLLANSDTEKDFENWCVKNYWVFGNYYVATEDIHQISNAEKVDQLIKSAINQYRDIIEFKKPSFEVLSFDRSHSNYYFSAEASKAISQCVNYSDVFSLEASNGLHRHKDIVAYYPKSIIVIGRSNNFTEEQTKALHGLNSRLNGIVVKTYDDLLAQAKSLLKSLELTDNEIFDPNANSVNTMGDVPFDDDMPF